MSDLKQIFDRQWDRCLREPVNVKSGDRLVPNRHCEKSQEICRLIEGIRDLSKTDRLNAILDMLPDILHHMADSRDVDFVGYTKDKLTVLLTDY